MLDISVQEGRQKLREQFTKNAHVRDPRVLDMLVIKVNINVHTNNKARQTKFVVYRHMTCKFTCGRAVII